MTGWLLAPGIVAVAAVLLAITCLIAMKIALRGVPPEGHAEVLRALAGCLREWPGIAWFKRKGQGRSEDERLG